MAKTELDKNYAEIAKLLPEGVKWHYKSYLNAGRVEHEWAVPHKDHGGVHVHGFKCEYGNREDEWLGGIEVHRLTPPSYGDQENPSHSVCWLLHAPCWHDGTSLSFTEQVAYALPSYGSDTMMFIHHKHVTRVMMHWYHSHFIEVDDD